MLGQRNRLYNMQNNPHISVRLRAAFSGFLWMLYTKYFVQSFFHIFFILLLLVFISSFFFCVLADGSESDSMIRPFATHTHTHHLITAVRTRHKVWATITKRKRKTTKKYVEKKQHTTNISIRWQHVYTPSIFSPHSPQHALAPHTKSAYNIHQCDQMWILF